MMMRYKLATKLCTRVPSSPNHDNEEKVSMTTPFSSSLADVAKVQPKRVSLCSLSSYYSTDSLGYSVPAMESPIPKKHTAPEKPSKLAAPSEVCFSPIDACRRLEFETPDALTLEKMDSFPQRAALVSPRLTPVSTAGGQFEAVLNQTKKVPSFPSGFYMPTRDETKAATLLMALKRQKDETAHDEQGVEAPILFTAPKRDRAKLSRAAKEVCHDLRDVFFLPEGDDWEEPSKKKRVISRTSPKRSTPPSDGSRTEVQSAAVTLDLKQERSVSLAMPDDSNELNSLHCFVRSDLLEVFSMEDDSSSKRGRTTARVGLRCVHCGHLPRKQKEGASMSIFYPKSLQDIYRSVCTWQRIHFKACKHVPQELVEQYDYFKDMDRTRGKKQHWVDSAYRLGLRNFDDNRGGIVWKSDRET